MGFTYHLWLPFLDQPQSDIVVFAIRTFHIYNILVKKCKHVIGPNDIITFSQELEFISESIIELVNNDEYSHEEAVLIFITNKDLILTVKTFETKDENGNHFEVFYS